MSSLPGDAVLGVEGEPVLEAFAVREPGAPAWVSVGGVLGDVDNG